MQERYLLNLRKQFEFYKILGDKTFKQLSEKDLFASLGENSNSLSTIVQHLNGNMLSRFTDFLTSDGEKDWRKRDQEFEPTLNSQNEVLQAWEEGWICVFNALNTITDLDHKVYIRNQEHTVYEALNRQLGHYAYHVGQLVFIGKCIKGENWKSLSIPRGESEKFNEAKFAKTKHKQHYTDEFRNTSLS